MSTRNVCLSGIRTRQQHSRLSCLQSAALSCIICTTVHDHLANLPYPSVSSCLQKADLWSCGVILFALLYGHHPFSVTDKKYARKVVRGEYIIPETTHVSAGCVQLVQALLEPDPEKRITLQQVLELPWFHTDLPEGALAMNQFYCNFSISLDQVCTHRVWPAATFSCHGTGHC